MRLYNSPVSGNCYKVRLLAAHLGLEVERIEVDVIDRSNRAELLADKNPGLRVPVLLLDDGRSLAESNAILWYLADGTSYLPADPFERAKVLQWLFFEQYSHEPFVAVARFWISVIGEPERFAGQLEEKQQGGYAALDAMEKHLAGRAFFVGDGYSIADIALYAYTHVAEEGGFDLGRYSEIPAWLARVRSQAGHIPIGAP